MNMFCCLGFFSLPGGGEWIIIAIIGLLVFGNRLPEVAKAMGKSVTEFKKGLRDIEDEIDRSVTQRPTADSSHLPAELDPPSLHTDPAGLTQEDASKVP